MASATRTRKTRKTTKQQNAEAQAAADAAADIEQEQVESETPQPQPEGETANEQPQPEANEPTEEERFEADVTAKLDKDPAELMQGMMALHTQAVNAEAKLDATLKAYREKNAKAIETLETGKIRLAAARTALVKEWREAVNTDEQTTTVENEGETPDTVYYNALHFAFDDGVAENAKGPEKEYWLAAQSYNRIADSMDKEPANVATLRETAEKTAQAYNWAQAVYNEVIKRRLA